MADKILNQELADLKLTHDAPEWMTDKGYSTISRGYRLKGESPKMMYERVANSVASYCSEYDYQGDNSLAQEFFDAMWNNWLCPASPILSNCGTKRGLPISCFGIDPDDSVYSILEKNLELANLTKAGGGVGVGFNKIRPAGRDIAGGANGKSDGILAFAPIYDKTINGISQGSTRRGAASINLDIDHGDFDEFIRMRRPEGDVNRQCLNLHHCVTISDEFIKKVREGDEVAREKWTKVMVSRFETGEPYIMYKDHVNKANPLGYQKHGLNVSMTNICSEITLHTDALNSFICCLSSLNLVKFDEWKNSNLLEIATLFLNGVLNEFIDKSKDIPGLENVRRHAEKGRAIGIGVLGWHTLLQERSIPFDSFDAMMLNGQIFNNIKSGAEAASRKLAEKMGEPLWCEGSGLFNSHLTAVAPTRSNSIISGGVSAGIEPIIRNVYTDKTSKGIFMEKNRTLEDLLESKSRNTDGVWDSIIEAGGSVQHLTYLSAHEKEVFLTAFEINQAAIIKQAAQRTPMIDQSQSLNLFFPSDTEAGYFNDVHLLAHELGVKTLYYVRSESKLKSGSNKRAPTIEECKACEG